MAAVMKALREGMETLTGTVNGLETKIMDKIRVVIKQETQEFNNELDLLKGKISQLEDTIKHGLPIKSELDIDRSVIIINLSQHEGEDVVVLCTGLFTNVLEVAATVTRAERTAQRDPNRPTVIKCELAIAGKKINILGNKKKCKDNDDTTRVFIARMRLHEERLNENNIKTLLNEFPDMKNNFRFTGSGRLVDKRQAMQPARNGWWIRTTWFGWTPTEEWGHLANCWIPRPITNCGRRCTRWRDDARWAWWAWQALRREFPSPATPDPGKASTQRGGGTAGRGGTFGDANRHATRNTPAAGADGNRGDRR